MSHEALSKGVLWQALFKLRWADIQFVQAVELFNDWYNAGGTGIRETFDEDTKVYRTVLYAERLPMHLPLLIGSGIHSLRSALDTAVSTLVREAGGQEDARINFPVHQTEREFIAAFEPGTRTCPDCKTVRATKAPLAAIRRHLPDLERLLIDELRPWEGGNYPLWALSKLDNIQKHRMLLLVLSQSSGSMDFHTVEGMTSQYCLWQVGPGMSMEIASSRHPLIISRPGGVSCELQFPRNIPFGGKPVFEVLSQMYKLVEGILVTLQAHFEGGETPPMGESVSPAD